MKFWISKLLSITPRRFDIEVVSDVWPNLRSSGSIVILQSHCCKALLIIQCLGSKHFIKSRTIRSVFFVPFPNVSLQNWNDKIIVSEGNNRNIICFNLVQSVVSYFYYWHCNLLVFSFQKWISYSPDKIWSMVFTSKFLPLVRVLRREVIIILISVYVAMVLFCRGWQV